jgi:hypothetical protein
MTTDALSVEQERRLAAVLDAIIPPSDDGRLPGAGEIGLASSIADAAGPEGRAQIARGLDALDLSARDRGRRDFADLAADQKEEALGALEIAEPGLVAGLLLPLYVAYYQHPRVLAGLGLEVRPPFPEGWELAPFDPALVEGVRRRPIPYRE